MSFFKCGFLVLVFASLLSCAGTRVRPSGRQGLLSAGRPSPTARVGRIPTAQEIELAKLTWPLRSMQVTSRFGYRGGDRHEGVDLKAFSGTPIYAAQNGTVLYAGSRISGYGKLTILKHEHGLATVYAHQSKIVVLKGQKVKQGVLIGYSGKTGHVSGPHLHYEVRSGTTPLDPALFIAQGGPPPRPVPKRAIASASSRSSAAEMHRVPLQRQRRKTVRKTAATQRKVVREQKMRVSQAQALRHKAKVTD